MADAIAAALITATGTVGGAILGALVTNHQKNKEARKAAQRSETIVKSFKETLRDYFGFNAATVYSRSEILNLNGDSRTTRGWKGIQVSKGFTLAYIPGRLQVLTPGGAISSGPHLSNVNQFPKLTSLTVVRQTTTECDYQVEIQGSLTPAEPPLSYEIKIEYSKSALMTREEVEMAYGGDEFKHDYHGLSVEFPIDELILEVLFPAAFPVSLFAGVFYGRTELMHDQELQRVGSGFQRTERGATFTINDPLVGFRYFIYWTFPSKN